MTAGTLYSAADVANLLGLHVRTVRNYVRDGRLPAVRIGKQYRIAQEDVDKLTGGRAAPAVSPPPVPARVEVSAVVQIEEIDAPTMARVSSLVGGAVSGRSGDARMQVETVYDRQRRTLRVIAIGSAEDTSMLIGLIGAFAESEL